MKKIQWLVVVVLAVFVSGSVHAQAITQAIPAASTGIQAQADKDAKEAAAKQNEKYIIEKDKAKQQIEYKKDSLTIKPERIIDIKDKIRIPMEATGRVFAFSRWAGTSVCSAFIKDASGN
ncbi:MAG TPA: hypothetical protein PLY45_05100, partial [bacterium]|nr:hypothetical protein [bacterium]